MSNLTIERPSASLAAIPEVADPADTQPDPMSVCPQHPKAWSILQFIENRPDGLRLESDERNR